jgi:hypothetical protein
MHNAACGQREKAPPLRWWEAQLDIACFALLQLRRIPASAAQGKRIDGNAHRQSCDHHRRGYGIGREIALAFASEGARITIAARSAAPMKQTTADLEALKCRALAVPTDVTKIADCERMVERTVATFGRVDILINNAGIAGPTQTTADMELAEWQEVIDTNLTGAWLSARAALPIL